MIISHKTRLNVMPDGNLAMEIGNCEAVLILTPKEGRKLATRIRSALGAHEDLIAERNRIDQAIAYQRRQWLKDRPNTHRPTRSEHSLEGTAVNGPIPVGQEAESD